MLVDGDVPTPLVVSWVPHHGRSEGLARALGACTVWAPWARSGGPRWRSALGWVRSALRTARAVLGCRRGALVVVMVPPVFALLTVVLVAPLRRALVVADLHSGALNDPSWAWSHRLLARCLAHCGALLTTNLQLLDGVDTGGCRALVLHDPPAPVVQPGRLPPLPEGPVAVFPASGADDEPLDVVVAAAALLRGEVSVVVTGRQRPELPSTDLVLPGYLDDASFAALLQRADVILALTTREATMQRAGYEALALHRPLVCSDTAVLVEAFAEACVPTAATAAALAAAVRTALADAERLSAAAADVDVRMRAQVDRALDDLREAARRHVHEVL